MKSLIRSMPVLWAVLLSLASGASGESSEFKKFEADYSNLDIDLLNNPCEVASVKDFVYEKDLAKFIFTEGTFYFLRYVNERPTTAIFLGKGKAEIQIPSHAERNSLLCITNDSIVGQIEDNSV